MLSFDLKASLQKCLEEGATELRQGNPQGFIFVSRALIGALVYSDDENVAMMYHVIDSVSSDFIEKQLEKEGGREFIETLGSTVEKLAEAYGAADSKKVDSLLRELVLIIVKRWRKSPLLTKELRIGFHR